MSEENVANEITVLLADDHTVLRQGMAQVLEMQPDMRVVAQADDGEEAVGLVGRHRPDIVLMDINMPGMDGVEAARRITAQWPETGVIILTMYRRDDYVFEAIKAGANGYLLKEVELDELLSAVRSVARDEAVIDSAIASRVLAEFRRPRQTEEEIADQLSIAEKTVRNRLSGIFRRLHLENRTQAALYAVREGIADPEEGELGEE